MALYMPPIARKKRVPEKYNPDTFRVVSNDAETYHPKFPDAVIKPVYDSDPRPARTLLPGIPVRQTRILPHTTYDFRAHNPHPVSCGFLRHNARLLNEPVCTVFTRRTHPEQHLWWPSRTSSEPLEIPGYTHDTIYRKDFQFASEGVPKGSSRHTANPNTEPALGSVPVNFLLPDSRTKRLYKEGLSFEHQYDSRADPNYPIRSKRHGAFVWDQLKPDKAQLLIDYHENVAKRRAAEDDRKASHTKPSPTEPASASPFIHSGPTDSTPGFSPVDTRTTPGEYHFPLADTQPFPYDTSPFPYDTQPVFANTYASGGVQPGPSAEPPSPPVWPYPAEWNSPSPPRQVQQVNGQGEITPEDFQSANLEAAEIVPKDVATSTVHD